MTNAEIEARVMTLCGAIPMHGDCVAAFGFVSRVQALREPEAHYLALAARTAVLNAPIRAKLQAMRLARYYSESDRCAKGRHVYSMPRDRVGAILRGAR